MCFLTHIHATSPEVNDDCVWTEEWIKLGLAPLLSLDKISCLRDKAEKWRSWNCSPNSWNPLHIYRAFLTPWKCQIFSALHKTDCMNYLSLGKFENFTGLLDCLSRSINWILLWCNCQQPYCKVCANPASYSSNNIERKILLGSKFRYAQNSTLKDHPLRADNTGDHK